MACGDSKSKQVKQVIDLNTKHKTWWTQLSAVFGAVDSPASKPKSNESIDRPSSARTKLAGQTMPNCVDTVDMTVIKLTKILKCENA